MTKKTFDAYVCVDCGFYLANGMPDEPAKDWSPKLIEDRWYGLHIVNGDSDKDREFSWSPCEGCGSRLGGTRMHCVAWEKERTPT